VLVRCTIVVMPQTATVGTEFARALAAKDRARLSELLDANVDFCGLTPGRNWRAQHRDGALKILLDHWFEVSDEITAVESIESDAFADRQRVGYRFRVENPEGRFLVEQQAYIGEKDGTIGWVRIVCSGFRPF
jgi:hypothetical protein